MKIKNIFLLFFGICLLTSCTQNTSENKSKKNKSELTENDVNSDEDFHAFLVDFNHKPTFQRQRVLFPVDATLLDPSEHGMEMVKEKIDYQDWLLLDFSYDSTFVTRQMDRYEQNIRLYSDSALIEQRGIDNGIFADFLFTKKEGKWFLESFTDVSY